MPVLLNEQEAGDKETYSSVTERIILYHGVTNFMISVFIARDNKNMQCTP